MSTATRASASSKPRGKRPSVFSRRDGTHGGVGSAHEDDDDGDIDSSPDERTHRAPGGVEPSFMQADLFGEGELGAFLREKGFNSDISERPGRHLSSFEVAAHQEAKSNLACAAAAAYCPARRPHTRHPQPGVCCSPFGTIACCSGWARMPRRATR